MFQERPLNLSCKRKKVECENPPQHLERKTTLDSANTSSISVNLPLHSALSHNAMEQAMLQYQAQVLASNDILRALVHKKWEDTIALQRPLLASTTLSPAFPHPWVAANAFHSYQHLLHPTSSTVNGIFGSSIATRPTKAERNSPLHQDFSIPPPVSSETNLPPASTSSINEISGSPISNSAIDFANYPPSSKVDSVSNSIDLSTDAASLSPVSTSSLSPNHDVIEGSRKRKRSKRSDDKTTDKDSYPCSICGASYPHKFELNRHIKVSHVRPHRCDQCGKGFGHRNYLKVHIETVHLGQKSHQCRLCGKYLSTGGNLNVHVRTIHFGEKKYNCPVCNRSFGQQCNMKTHMKRHYSKSD